MWPDSASDPALRVVEEERESVVGCHPEIPAHRLAREGAECLALVEHQTGILPGAHGYDEEHAVVTTGPEPGQVEVEPGEVIGLVELELQLFVELPAERLQRLLSGIHRAAEAAPMIRVPDIRLVVTVLEHVRAVVEDDQGGDGVGSGEANARIVRW